MSIGSDEQETIINMTREGDTAIIYTTDVTMMTKLDKLAEKYPLWKVVKEHRHQGTNELVGKTYETAKELISFRSDFKKLSAETRRAASERAKRNLGRSAIKTQ